MTPKKLILYTTLFNIISWASLVLIIYKIEPCLTYSATTFCEEPAIPAIILLYSSLFFALTSTFTIIGYIARIYLHNNEIFAFHFNSSLRQALLLSICILSCLVLFTFHILNWVSTAVIFGLVILIELYFLNNIYQTPPPIKKDRYKL